MTKNIIALGLALLLCGSKTYTPPQIKPKSLNKYNVILISADTLRADMLGFNGNKEIQTPHLDRLAQESINFPKAYANITTTNPSHSSMLSSLYPMDHKTYSNTTRLSSKILTLPEILRKNGWHTAAIANMPWLNPEVGNILQGIKEFKTCKRTRKADKTNHWVLDFLDRQKSKDRPFFLFVHYVDTHTPYHAPEKYQHMYYPPFRNPQDRKFDSLRQARKQFPKHYRNNRYIDDWLRGIRDVDYVIASNKGSVSWLDAHVGAVIDRLKDNNLWENSIVIFTSDHGESLGEHGLWFVHGGLYDVTARVPLLVRIPHKEGGQNITSLVQHIDLVPTVLEELNIEWKHPIRGQSLFKRMNPTSIMDKAVFIEHAGRYMDSVATQRYKYIRHRRTKNIYPTYPLKAGTEELYDLLKDPGETKNIIDEKPVVRKTMAQLLHQFRSQKKTRYQHKRAKIDKNTREILHSLGYL